MARDRIVYDISLTLGREAPVYPGDPAFQQRLARSFDAGDGLNLTELAMSVHTGTHLDAPWHFEPEGRTLESFPLERFLRPAVVVHAEGDAVTADDVERAELLPGDAILFRTRNSETGRARSSTFRTDYVALAPEAAEACVRREVSLVGIDAPSIDPHGGEGHPAHHVLLRSDVLILEGLTLADVPPNRYTLVCLPLKLAATEAAPTRAVLLHPHE